MLLITGLGRCGTSVLTLFYKNLGYNVGCGSWSDERNAGLEDARVQLIHAYYYSFGERGEATKVRTCLSKLRDCDVLKDPRIAWAPGVLRLWQDVYRSDLKIIVLDRDFAQIKLSRDHMGVDHRLPSMDRVEDMAGLFYRLCLEILYLDIEFILIRYPNFLSQYDHIYNISQRFGLTFDKDRGKAIWDETIDLSKVHQYGGDK